MTTPDPIHLAAFLGCLAFLVGIANGVLKLVDRVKGRGTMITPQPLKVEEATKFITKRECDIEHAATLQRIQAAEMALANTRSELRDDIKGVHARIDDILNAVVALRSDIRASGRPPIEA